MRGSLQKGSQMNRWLSRLLILELLVVLTLVACDDDDGGTPMGTDPASTAPDISSFTGAWVIHRSGSTTTLGCSDTCQTHLTRVLDAYFEISGDSACVRIDTLLDLVLLEPFISNGEISGSVADDVPVLSCEYTDVLQGDTLVTSFSVQLFGQNEAQSGYQGFQAYFTVSVDEPRASVCGGCRALLGIAGIRRPSGECGP